MIGIMRHGKTDWNVYHKIQGQTDIELNDDGRAAAVAAASKYKDMHFDVCYVSPLKRARETARIFLKDTDTQIIIDDRIKELGFGSYEGTKDVYQKPDCPLYKLFFDTENYVAMGGSESISELYDRVRSFLDERLKPHIEKGENVLVIAHGALNACLINILLDNPVKDYWKYGQANCEIFRFFPDDIEKTKRINSKTIDL